MVDVDNQVDTEVEVEIHADSEEEGELIGSPDPESKDDEPSPILSPKDQPSNSWRAEMSRSNATNVFFFGEKN